MTQNDQLALSTLEPQTSMHTLLDQLSELWATYTGQDSSLKWNLMGLQVCMHSQVQSQKWQVGSFQPFGNFRRGYWSLLKPTCFPTHSMTLFGRDLYDKSWILVNDIDFWANTHVLKLILTFHLIVRHTNIIADTLQIFKLQPQET